MSFSSNKTIRILLVDDHKSFMEGLAMVINSQKPVMEIIGQVSTPAEAIDFAGREKPDVILLDMDLGTILSIEILPELLKQSDAKILILTGIQNSEIHDRAVTAGARGVILKSEPAKVIIKAIEKVYHGEIWVDSKTLSRVLSQMSSRQNVNGGERENEERRKIAELTPREREIIKTLVIFEDSTNQEIAARLFISQSTLKNHLTTIYSKLGVKNRIQLLKYALAHNLAKTSN